MLYIIVLCLTASDYAVDITLLSKEVNLQPEKLTHLAHEAGCQIIRPSRSASVGNNENSTVVSTIKANLIIPLKFPEKRAPIRAKNL